MAPKARTKRSGSVSAASSNASFDDETVSAPSAVPIPAQGAAVSKHRQLNNKSGPPSTILAAADLSYTGTTAYWSQKGKAVDATMPTWIVYWFMISAVVMAWDAGFVLTRETHSSSAWHQVVYAAYHKQYTRVDKFYGDYGADASPGYLAWARSQTQVNVAEVALQLLAAGLSGASIGSVVGLIVSVSTFIKTVLYMLIIANSPNPAAVLPSLALATSQDRVDFFGYFICTNGIWIVVPALVISDLAGRIITATQHS